LFGTSFDCFLKRTTYRCFNPSPEFNFTGGGHAEPHNADVPLSGLGAIMLGTFFGSVFPWSPVAAGVPLIVLPGIVGVMPLVGSLLLTVITSFLFSYCLQQFNVCGCVPTIALEGNTLAQMCQPVIANR
jgi:hypothetical protein